VRQRRKDREKLKMGTKEAKKWSKFCKMVDLPGSSLRLLGNRIAREEC